MCETMLVPLNFFVTKVALVKNNEVTVTNNSNLVQKITILSYMKYTWFAYTYMEHRSHTLFIYYIIPELEYWNMLLNVYL